MFIAVQRQEMKAPLISICVPVYNGSRYLDACLASIASQTFADFEVLIVDDCSTDDGPALARAWAARDRRFEFHVNDKNLGLVGNWNRCIELAKGEWIKFLFQDDLMQADCLAVMLQAGETGGGFVACAREVIYEEPVDYQLREFYERHQAALNDIYRQAPRLDSEGYCRAKLSASDLNVVGEPSVTLIRRALFKRFGNFDPLLVQLCDSEMWNRLGCNVGIDYISQKLVSFRVHGGSATRANQSRRFRAGSLDEIVELTRLFKSPQLRGFQRYLTSVGRSKSFRRAVTRQINRAFEKARLAEIAGDRSLKNEMNAVMACLPGCHQNRFIYFLYTLKRVVREFAAPRMNRSH